MLPPPPRFASMILTLVDTGEISLGVQVYDVRLYDTECTLFLLCLILVDATDDGNDDIPNVDDAMHKRTRTEM